MWTYSQTTGLLTDASGAIIGRGYSGRDRGLNDPAYSDMHNVGPIPQGKWTIGCFFDDHGGKGPLVCHLTPDPETHTFGRSGFMIHGDNSLQNYTASHGCIILSRPARKAVSESCDGVLEVTK